MGQWIGSDFRFFIVLYYLLAKMKTQKLSASKCKGRKLTAIGRGKKRTKNRKKMRTRNTGVFLLGHVCSTNLAKLK